MSWRDRARNVIREVSLNWRDACGRPLCSLGEPEKERLLATVRRAYPFGTRDCYPYKVWLEEVARFARSLKREPEPIDTGLFSEPGRQE